MRSAALSSRVRRRTVTAALAVVTSAVLAGSATGTASGATPSVAVTPAAAVAAQVVPVADTRQTPPTTVMVIRHGEKPHGDEEGIDAAGHEDDSSLTRTGWERARKLTSTFGPPRAGLKRPARIYAARANAKGEGARTRETVAPLASKLGVAVNTRFGKGDEQALVRDASSRPGPALISWSHKNISKIADAFPGVTPRPPSSWPDDRFDVVWVFTRTATGWHFSQVPEMALAKDKASVIKG